MPRLHLSFRQSELPTSRRFERAWLLALGTVLALPFAPARGQVTTAPSSVVALPARPLKVIDVAFIDTTVRACTDFFQFANGAWLAKDTIPAAYSASGVARDMGDRNELAVRSVLDDVLARQASLPKASTPRKLATFYGTCMDSSAAEHAGLAPMQPMLSAIDGITTRAALVRRIADMQIQGIDIGFRFGPEVGAHDAAHYVASIYQGGLGLPDRDYYFNKGAAPDSTRRQYVDHVARIFALAGNRNEADARAAAERVLAFETSLAAASMTRIQRRDPAATDHLMPVAKLRALAPHVAWSDYFSAVKLSVPVAQLNVGMPDFVHRVDSLIADAPLADWRAYLRYHAIADAAPWLSTPFVQEEFAFSSRFSGAKALLPRWKRCLRASDALLGEALGETYVAKTFSPDARKRAKAVIDDIRASFGQRLDHLSWMSDSTRAQARTKLASMGEKVGYPERWRDYRKLQVEQGPFALNVMRANAFEWQRTINRPGAAVDTTEWSMTVPTVNAYYDPSKNEMVFPAGALSPQTFDATTDDAANYGSLGGSWAGHELTHGFDDEGRHYDARGNLRDWWTPADSLRFTEQAQLIVKQFNEYVQIDTFHVNGPLTLGENIADFGGVVTAYDALQRALARNGRPGLIEGYTPEQRYFLGYAQSWRSHDRPERLRTRVTVDPHAPARWRTNGPLANSEAFAKAFDCKPGDPMVRAPEVVPHIW